MIHPPILLSSAYLPPISYVARFFESENIILDKYEFFSKQTIRNRCYIVAANGILPLIIPVTGKSKQRTAMQEVCISNDIQWQKIHWKSIESAYRNSPFFEYYEDHFHEFYDRKYELLFDFNIQILTKIKKILKLETPFTFSNTYHLVHPDLKLVDFRNHSDFDRKNISSVFTNFPYQQVFANRHAFLPDLSIIDLLSNTGPHAKAYLENLNITKQSFKTP